MASAAKRRTKGSKASDGKRKRKNSGSDEEGPAFLSSKYAERPTSKIYNSRFNHTQPAELFRKDLISAMKLPDNEPLSSDDYWLIEDSWKPEWERGVQVPVFPEALPKPDIRILRKRSKEANFKLPKKLIRFTRDSFFNPEVHVMSYTNTLAERTCRYDMDDIDFQWLTSVNQDREDFGLQPLEETFVEQVIEEFEVQAYVNFQEAIKSEEGLGVEYDEDAICDVCRSPDSLESNEMVFCDSCNICVHQICYGITKIPEGSWICRTCALGIRPPCVLCPNRGGAMKTIRTGQKWAHVGCAVWIPEVSFLNFVKMEPIIKISQVPASRWSLVCTLCNEKKGACITCSEKGCKAAFHVTCAFNEGLQMRASVKSTCVDDDDDELKAFCQKHGKRKFSIFSDSEEDMSASPNKSTLTSEERANLRQQKIQEKEAEFYNYVNIDEVSEMFQCDKTDIETIFNYWKLKRKSNWNRQFLTPKIDTESNCTEENSPISFLKKMVHHRQDLERARNLCYMVIKRERQVKRWTEIKEKIFLKQLEVLKKEGKSMSEDKRQAVLDSNLGDIAYDKKFSGMNGPSPNMVSVITNLVGEEMVKTQINGVVKSQSPKKSNRRKPERTPNPYAKHYLNGLVKRSQRWFPVKDKPNKSNRTSLQKSKSNKSLSSQYSTNHVIHNVDTSEDKSALESDHNSRRISQDSDIKDFNAEVVADVSVSCTVDSEPSETKESISASFVDEISKDTQDSSSNHMYDVYDISVSEVYNVSDLSVSDVYPFVELQSDLDSFIENSSNAVDSADSTTAKLETNSDSENSSGKIPFTLKMKPQLQFCDKFNFNGKTKVEPSKLRNYLLSDKSKKEKLPGAISNFKQEFVNNIKGEIIETVDYNSEIIDEALNDRFGNDGVIASFKLDSVINNKNTAVDKYSNQKSDHSKQKLEDTSDCNGSTVKVDEKSIDIKNILDNSRLKVSLNRNLAYQIEHNHVKLPQPIVVLKSEDIVNCEKGKSYVSNSKPNKVTKCTEKMSKKVSSNINKSCEKNPNCIKPSESSVSKSEDKLELKFRPMSSKNSPVRTQSPTPSKAAETVKFKSSPKHNSHYKADIPSKSFNSKQKNLNSQVSGSSSVNKCPSSPLTKCQEKNPSTSTKSDYIELKDSKEKTTMPDSSESKEKPSESLILPTLKGYKIPKKPRLGKLDQSSLELKRGNSPLSPLPNITPHASTVNSYQTNHPAPTNYQTNHTAPANYQTNHTAPANYQTNHTAPVNYQTNHTNPANYQTNHTAPANYQTNHPTPATYPTNHPTPATYPTSHPAPATYQTNHTNGKCSWRKMEPRSEKPVQPPPCNTWNGEVRQVAEERCRRALVMTLKKDRSDPKSQTWLQEERFDADSPFNRGGGMPGWDFPPGHIQPRLPPRFSPPIHAYPPPVPVQWAPMRSRGGFSQVHRNYRPGPYT